MTLPRFFGLVVGGLALLAGGVLLLAVRAAGRSVISTAETARASRASAVASAVEADLGVAEHAMEDFEQALAARIVDAADAESVRRALTGELIALRTLTDLTLTSATLESYDPEGEAILAPTGRRQLSVFRERAGGLGRRSIGNVAPGSQTDPTLHDTFRAAANRDVRGRALWSDLAYSELDATMARGLRRKTMTVQKAIFTTVGASTRFVGVLRAGIVSDALDRIGAAAPGGDPHQLFICDSLGRLITRLSPDDPYVEVGPEGQPDPDGDLRVAPRVVPGPVAAALSAARQGDRGGQRMNVGGRPFLLTLVPVAEGRAQQWLVGIVVPESAYVGELSKTRDRLLVLLSIVVVAIMAVGLLGARTIGRGVRALVHSTDAMRRFSFQPAAPGGANSLFVEIGSALESVERAKTALRAMVKYVPIDLVRRLYESGTDPKLGAELTEVTLMFTDIADFTTHAESLTPARLAEALGRYLQAATEAVEATGGTVDKYIGDALMVLWNAPERLSAHATAACRAALGCAAATRALG
ncbi:MAG TPA: adenylate/guanylate cyclase domain-containing protein, partial [Polyangia bacterium]|nr:adenylate/guanylate cyclase domain-containing protein [Polyangia bacterium]